MKKINLSIDKLNPENSFKRIALELMNKWAMVSGENEFRITEIEFYLRTTGNSEWHQDHFVHGHELQKTSHRWYFHGAGIDLTFGQEDYYGGILLRAIYDFKNDRYHYGPLKLLVELFGHFPEVYATNPTFGLKSCKENQFEIETPIAARRVGLNPKTDIDMYNKNYRFFIMPKKQHANKTGIIAAMQAQGYSEKEINNIWG